jgi:ABC-type transport system involved in multi-copper enzyme maturation permease subunit
MRPVLLIASNFLRESRWAILLLLLWAVISGAAAAYSVKQSQDDALFFLKQQAVYGVVFTAFLASSAIYNQRRSRRILAVLSKAISRAEYLAGLEVGVLVAAAVYSGAFGVMGAWVFARAGFSVTQVIPIAIMLFAASALAGSVALLFSTFLSPLFAIALTAIVVGINGVFVQMSSGILTQVMPTYVLMQSIVELSLENWTPAWAAVGWALLESVAVWALASLIFSYRDLAVAIE